MNVINDEQIVGDTTDCLLSGEYPYSEINPQATDPYGIDIGPVYEYFSPVAFISRHSYLPGDANMANGIWPPQVIGSDVTYMVNYFRGFPSSQTCLLDGFWCSADVNGDCNIIRSDVTKLVTYFRGLTELSFCPDYEPAWPTFNDLAPAAPAGWPNCE